jgi:hypothetical protein
VWWWESGREKHENSYDKLRPRQLTKMDERDKREKNLTWTRERKKGGKRNEVGVCGSGGRILVSPTRHDNVHDLWGAAHDRTWSRGWLRNELPTAASLWQRTKLRRTVSLWPARQDQTVGLNFIRTRSSALFGTAGTCAEACLWLAGLRSSWSEKLAVWQFAY